MTFRSNKLSFNTLHMIIIVGSIISTSGRTWHKCYRNRHSVIQGLVGPPCLNHQNHSPSPLVQWVTPPPDVVTPPPCGNISTTIGESFKVFASEMASMYFFQMVRGWFGGRDYCFLSVRQWSQMAGGGVELGHICQALSIVDIHQARSWLLLSGGANQDRKF